MHLLAAQAGAAQAEGEAIDLGQAPGEIVFASAADSELNLLAAATDNGVAPGDCVYVGDDERDIEAARRAGMKSVAALWGYRLDGDDPTAWGADLYCEAPRDLLAPGALAR